MYAILLISGLIALSSLLLSLALPVSHAQGDKINGTEQDDFLVEY